MQFSAVNWLYGLFLFKPHQRYSAWLILLAGVPVILSTLSTLLLPLLISIRRPPGFFIFYFFIFLLALAPRFQFIVHINEGIFAEIGRKNV